MMHEVPFKKTYAPGSHLGRLPRDPERVAMEVIPSLAKAIINRRSARLAVMWPDQPKTLKSDAACAERRRFLASPHMEPLAKYVIGLRAQGRGAVPDFDPLDGGTNATLMLVLQNPGPKAVASGFISRDNNDQTAANTFHLLREAHVPRDRTTLWNIVPWFSGLSVRDADLDDGAAELQGALQLLPHLKAIVFVGLKAQRGASRVRLPDGVRMFSSYHPGPKVMARHPDYRALILEQFRLAWDTAGLRSSMSLPGRAGPV
jgi:hypothetical protein